MSRKEKTDDLMKKHLPLFKVLKVVDPFFTLKSAYFISGKKGRYIQLFESELTKNKDVYTEFVNKDLVPDLDDRPLFKLTYNPFYKEEYEIEHKVTDEGREYSVYIIPVVELKAILSTGVEISYSDYEGGMYDVKESSPFPNFEDEFLLKSEQAVVNNSDESTSDILLRIAADFQKLAQKLK
jgi:hypothetical protein